MNATPLKSSLSTDDASDLFKLKSHQTTTPNSNRNERIKSLGNDDISPWQAGMKRKLEDWRESVSEKKSSADFEKIDDDSKTPSSVVKHEDVEEEAHTSPERSHTTTTLMNNSFGSFTGSSHSSSGQPGDVTHYLCIPVDASGTADPSKAFFSATPPQNQEFAEECKNIDPRSSSELVSLLNDRANARHESPSDVQKLCPDTPISHRSNRDLSQSAPRARFPSEETPSPWTHDSRSRSRFGLPRSLPVASNRGGLNHRTVLASMPEEQTSIDHPYNQTPDTHHSSYINPAGSQRRIVYSGDRGRIVPMGSILSNDSIDSLADGAKRVVLAKDGTPMACVGNTMEVLAPTESSMDEQRKWQRWTDSEDEILRSAVEKEGLPHNWKKVSKKYFLGVRSDTQCKNRWKKALQPGLIRGCWTAEEDKTILECMDHGMKFAEIAKLLPGRISEQVKERWVNSVDPSLNRSEWTDDELHTLFAAQSRLGNQWKKIAELLPGRSENHVKNRWYNAKQAQRRKMKKLAAETEVVERLKRARGESENAPASEV